MAAEPRAEHRLREHEQEDIGRQHALAHPFECELRLAHVEPNVDPELQVRVVECPDQPARVGLRVAEEGVVAHRQRVRRWRARMQEAVRHDLRHRRPLRWVALEAPAYQMLRVFHFLLCRASLLIRKHRLELFVCAATRGVKEMYCRPRKCRVWSLGGRT